MAVGIQKGGAAHGVESLGQLERRVDGLEAGMSGVMGVLGSGQVRAGTAAFSVPRLEAGAWTADIGVPCALNGYTAIGVVGIQITGTYMPMKQFVSSAGQAVLRFFNPTSSAQDARDGTVYILYSKND